MDFSSFLSSLMGGGSYGGGGAGDQGPQQSIWDQGKSYFNPQTGDSPQPMADGWSPQQAQQRPQQQPAQMPQQQAAPQAPAYQPQQFRPQPMSYRQAPMLGMGAAPYRFGRG